MRRRSTYHAAPIAKRMKRVSRRALAGPSGFLVAGKRQGRVRHWLKPAWFTAILANLLASGIPSSYRREILRASGMLRPTLLECCRDQPYAWCNLKCSAYSDRAERRSRGIKSSIPAAFTVGWPIDVELVAPKVRLTRLEQSKRASPAPSSRPSGVQRQRFRRA